jgi:ABC-type sugar transport system substrate-binding protein
MSKSENTKSLPTAVCAGCAIALMGVCAGLASGAVQAEEKKFLIGIVELQLANPFFGRLEK